MGRVYHATKGLLTASRHINALRQRVVAAQRAYVYVFEMVCFRKPIYVTCVSFIYTAGKVAFWWYCREAIIKLSFRFIVAYSEMHEFSFQ